MEHPASLPPLKRPRLAGEPGVVDPLSQLRAAAKASLDMLSTSFSSGDADPGTVPGPAASGAAEAGVGEVCALLTKLGLEQYLQTFVQSGFDMIEAVRAMDESDMREECGMTAEHASLLQRELGAPGAAMTAAPPAAMAMGQVGGASAAAAVAAQPGFLGPGPPLGMSGPAAAFAATMPAGAPAMHALAAAIASDGDQGGHAERAAAEAGHAGQPGLPCAYSAASQALVPAGSPLDAYNQCYGLAQLAEESAQMNASAATFCASPAAGPFQIAVVAEVAQQAAQRAAWAATTLESFVTQQLEKGGDAGFIANIQQVATQAATTANEAAQTCKVRADGVRENVSSEASKSRKSRVPCKNFLARRCTKGAACDFSHDTADMQARPLMLKSMKQCIFYAKGNCMRGPACPFSHGEDESREIEKYVEILRKEKKMPGGLRR